MVTKGSYILLYGQRGVRCVGQIYYSIGQGAYLQEILVCVKGVLVCGSLLAGVRIGLAFIGHKSIERHINVTQAGISQKGIYRLVGWADCYISFGFESYLF